MNFENLIHQLQVTHDSLYKEAAKAINTTMTIRNWLYGYCIVEYEQNGEDRAKYGDKLIRSIADKLKHAGQKGMSFTNLNIFRQFYLTYPQIGPSLPLFFKSFPIVQTLSEQFQSVSMNQIIQAVPDKSLQTEQNEISQALPDKLQIIDIKQIPASGKTKSPLQKSGIGSERVLQALSFSHIVELIKIDDPLKRAFYELECVKGTWSTRELQRQIESLYFERSGLSKDKIKLSDLVNQKAVQLSPRDLINDPITVEFLGLSDRALVPETDLEQAILDHLQMFLLKLGHGFCFEARQKRILIDDEYYFIDLVFYHRILKCHILVDLKTEKFKHSHVGQMNTYLEYFKSEVMQEGDNPPVGILLCTDKGNTLVKYATAGLEKSVFVHKYLVQLPSKEELEKYLENV